MIHKEPLASYLKRRVFLGALGLSDGEPVVFSLLGQGEYNVNYSFIHPRTGKKLVLRINTGSQMHLEDQIGYEFTALQYLVPSGRTPKPLFCDREQGLLVMEWLPGRTLDYKTDMDEAAGILADIHSVPVPEGCRLIQPSCPAQAIYEECLDMVQHYYDWEKRDPEVEALLRQLVKETGNLPLTEKAGEGVPLCMVNTELNSGNFLIDPQGVSSLDVQDPCGGPHGLPPASGAGLPVFAGHLSAGSDLVRHGLPGIFGAWKSPCKPGYLPEAEGLYGARVSGLYPG